MDINWYFMLWSNPPPPTSTPLSTQAYALTGVRLLRKDKIPHLFAFLIPAKQCILFIKSEPVPVCHPHGCAKHLASASEEAF